ncbi:hypothetical protein L208DRAFT_1401791 [Tricholoma matsutake]|nr:hypothetical protein L208DRAFT_1401791 [Tricholoma matsutake 945]
MAPNDHLIENLCRDPETLNEAKIIFRIAQKKTAPGSGHDLGPHTTGLSAICAHIASQSLNSGDVSRKTAQIASCLKSSDFEKAFHIVQAAIGGSTTRPTLNQVYQSLLQKYTSPLEHNRLLHWLRATETALLQNDSRLDLEDLNVKCAIFFWVYNTITNKNVTTAQTFAQDNDIPQKSLTRLLNKIGNTCSSLKTRIQHENKPNPSSPTKATTTPRKSPNKTPLRALPSRDSPQKRSAPTLDHLFPESPTKRRKTVSSPSKATLLTKPIFPPPTPLYDVEMTTSSSTHHTPTHAIVPLDLSLHIEAPPSPLFSDPDEIDDTERSLPPRRFRPVYLDHKQWYARDSRLDKIWMQSKKRKQNMVQLYGHPLESLRGAC